MAAEAASTFSGSKDRFKGVTVVSKEEPCEPGNFEQKLKASLDKWSEEVRAL